MQGTTCAAHRNSTFEKREDGFGKRDNAVRIDGTQRSSSEIGDSGKVEPLNLTRRGVRPRGGGAVALCARCALRAGLPSAAERSRGRAERSRRGQRGSGPQACVCREACDWARRRRAAALQGGFVAQSLLHVCTDVGVKVGQKRKGDVARWRESRMKMVLSADKSSFGRKRKKESDGQNSEGLRGFFKGVALH